MSDELMGGKYFAGALSRAMLLKASERQNLVAGVYGPECQGERESST